MSARPGLSVVLITRNEAARIRACLASVSRWADEIVVVDQHSTDGTADICRALGARVIAREMLAGFGEQKNFAIGQATQPWVLSLDADEEVTEALRLEIEAAVARPGTSVGFRMPRLTSYLGRFIRHCGWYPSPVLRLFQRGRGRFDDALVHEELRVDGPVGDLRAPLDRIPLREELLRGAPQHLLLVGEREVHRLLGSPRTRSAMMLRRISEVPPSIVFPRERSCWRCQ